MNLLELDSKASAATAAIIDEVPRELLDAPTPCTQWTVRQVVSHMLDNDRFYLSDPAAGTTLHETGAAFTTAFATEAMQRKVIEFPAGKGSYEGRTVIGVRFVDVLVHGWDIGRAVGRTVTFDEELAAAAFAIASTYPDTPVLRGPGGAFAQPVWVSDDADATARLVALLGRDPSWSRAALVAD